MFAKTGPQRRRGIQHSLIDIGPLQPHILVFSVPPDFVGLSVGFHKLNVLIPELVIGHADGQIMWESLFEDFCVSMRGDGGIPVPSIHGKKFAYSTASQPGFPSSSSSSSERRVYTASEYISASSFTRPDLLFRLS